MLTKNSSGTGAIVRTTGAKLTTPDIGAATATSITTAALSVTALSNETFIYSLGVFNASLYGGTGTSGVDGLGKLYVWNGTNAWVEKAPQFGSEGTIRDLAAYRGKLYGSTFGTGLLLEWDGVDGWSQRASKPGSEYVIPALTVFQGRLFGCSADGGALYEWNGGGSLFM